MFCPDCNFVRPLAAPWNTCTGSMRPCVGKCYTRSERIEIRSCPPGLRRNLVSWVSAKKLQEKLTLLYIRMKTKFFLFPQKKLFVQSSCKTYKVIPVLFNWAPRHEGVLREWNYSTTHSMTSALDADEWSASLAGRFTHRERDPGTHWIGGWVNPRAFLDAVVKRKIPGCCHRESNPRTPIVQPVAQRYTDWAITTLTTPPYLLYTSRIHFFP
jgi:hypothetical protein